MPATAATGGPRKPPLPSPATHQRTPPTVRPPDPARGGARSGGQASAALRTPTRGAPGGRTDGRTRIMPPEEGRRCPPPPSPRPRGMPATAGCQQTAPMAARLEETGRGVQRLGLEPARRPRGDDSSGTRAGPLRPRWLRSSQKNWKKKKEAKKTQNLPPSQRTPPPMAMPPPAPAPALVRLRLVFENRRLLRHAQRDEGLRRCWLLLRPKLATVADLAAHVAARFRLRRSCPRGVVLSMDGFALPPFDSTCIFRDKDIIRVEQKTCTKLVGHNEVHCIQDPEVVEKRPLPVDDKILAIQYQENGSEYQEEEELGDRQPEENAIVSHSIENNGTSSKRKCHDGVAGIPKTKRKKLKVTNSGKNIDDSKEDNAHQYQYQSVPKKLMSSAIDTETKKATLPPETTTTLVEQQKAERNNQTELKCEAKVADCNAQNETKKSESRSARRKKIKRQMRQKVKLQTEKNVHEDEDSPIAADCPSSNNQDALPDPSSNQNGSHLPFSGHKADDEESDTSDEVVPVVVRPGHIRFEPAGGQPDKSPAKEIQGTFQWSATMSKKKGQKWGMNSSNKRNADIGAGSSREANCSRDSKITENGFCAVSNQKDGKSSNIEVSSVKTIANEEKFNGGTLDFESLYPLMRLPKIGFSCIYMRGNKGKSCCKMQFCVHSDIGYETIELLCHTLIS